MYICEKCSRSYNNNQEAYNCAIDDSELEKIKRLGRLYRV